MGRAASSGPPLVDRAFRHPERIAIRTDDGSFSYRRLLRSSAEVATRLLGPERDLGERTVATLLPPGVEAVAALWGIWRAGGIAVPLADSHPPRELEFVVRDSRAATVISSPSHEARIRPIADACGAQVLSIGSTANRSASTALPDVEEARRALILYTSGTTARPKGVVLTHTNLRAQVTSLVDAWGWRGDDCIVSVLPLHHVHGLVNVVCCALWSGATCRMLPSFDPERVWTCFEREQPTLFMAVPTVYVRLLDAWRKATTELRSRWTSAASRLRLTVSGSAALPVDVFERWREVGGQTLLERYGMTEIGMALSNALDGPRLAGHVGTPLPGVEVRLIDDDGRLASRGAPGEIEVRGPGVFLEYWGRSITTQHAFHEGWFRTGDVAVLDDGGYRILGRRSVDIIKTGGYKVSALEIESVLREHPSIADCAVVGVADRDWGQRVAAAVVARIGERLDPDALREWARERLASYKVPTLWRVVERLPRNPLGKVTKPAVTRWFSGESADS